MFQVSKVHEILITLGLWSKDVVQSNKAPGDVVAALQEINHIVLVNNIQILLDKI